MFEKRALLYEKKDGETWRRIRSLLKEGGFAGVRAGHYLHEVGCGCGAKLDPRDFNGKGKIDREIYWVKVPTADLERAAAFLREKGVEPEVDETVTMDALERKEYLAARGRE